MTGMLSERHQNWLEGERALDPELVTRQGLYTDRQSPDGRDLVFPYTRDGKIINRKYRSAGKKFRQDKDAPRAFYNEDSLRDPTLADYPIIITEGELDTLSAIMAGFPRTVSVPDGVGTNLDFIFEDATWSLVRDAPIILAVDGDPPGQKFRHDLACRLGPARCSWLDYPVGTKDLNDVLRLKGVGAVCDLIQKAKPYPIKGLYRLSELPDVGEPVTFETSRVPRIGTTPPTTASSSPATRPPACARSPVEKSRHRSAGSPGSGFLKLENGRSRSTTEGAQ